MLSWTPQLRLSWTRSYLLDVRAWLRATVLPWVGLCHRCHLEYFKPVPYPNQQFLFYRQLSWPVRWFCCFGGPAKLQCWQF